MILKGEPLSYTQHAAKMHGTGRQPHTERLGSYMAYLRQIELGFEPAKALYNLACVHARAGEVEQAIAYLERSHDAGFPALEYSLQDPDLESVRDHPALAALRE